MANHTSAKKRIRRNARRAAINGARMSRIRTFIKKVETAIASGDNDAAREALRVAQPEIQRGVSRGVLHRNTASRKISRRAARVKAIAASPGGRPPPWQPGAEAESRLVVGLSIPDGPFMLRGTRLWPGGIDRIAPAGQMAVA